MFGKSENDLCATLSRMEAEARDRANFSQSEARQKMAEWLQQDRRFDAYDKDRLVKRVQECRQSGACLDLLDPTLRGLPPRPLDRRYG